MCRLVIDMVRPARNSFFLVGILGVAMSGVLNAQTFNWGSTVFGEFVDSKGNTLHDIYLFEIESFENGVDSDDFNTEDWYSDWQTFDAADYNGEEETAGDGSYRYSTSMVQMDSSGTSGSASLCSGAISFEGLDAYLWVRNPKFAEEGSG